MDYNKTILELNNTIKTKYVKVLNQAEIKELKEMFIDLINYSKCDDKIGFDMTYKNITQFLNKNKLEEANTSLFYILKNLPGNMFKDFNIYYPEYKIGQPILTGNGILEELIRLKKENLPLTIKAVFDSKYIPYLKEFGVELEEVDLEDVESIDDIFLKEFANLHYYSNQVNMFHEILDYFSKQVSEITKVIPSIDFKSDLLAELFLVNDNEIESKLEELNNRIR